MIDRCMCIALDTASPTCVYPGIYIGKWKKYVVLVLICMLIVIVIYIYHTRKKKTNLFVHVYAHICMCIYIPSAPGSELSVVHKTLTRIPQTHTYLGPRKPLSSRSENTKSVSNSSFHTLLFISSFSGPKSAHIFTLHSEKADKCGSGSGSNPTLFTLFPLPTSVFSRVLRSWSPKAG